MASLEWTADPRRQTTGAPMVLRRVVDAVSYVAALLVRPVGCHISTTKGGLKLVDEEVLVFPVSVMYMMRGFLGWDLKRRLQLWIRALKAKQRVVL
ncbi:hypothetical protein CDEST_14753 [Colletotrichum destructivum]|uniref:Uncharacterized protein n=1 Tax=Colletotrichum destructivum TaxID=34406 RepID=A0AAX4J2F1_9PEZI|nr:hypothetical protein CDEST_14753 [Colletotrichum destructivum]